MLRDARPSFLFVSMTAPYVCPFWSATLEPEYASFMDEVLDTPHVFNRHLFGQPIFCEEARAVIRRGVRCAARRTKGAWYMHKADSMNPERTRTLRLAWLFACVCETLVYFTDGLFGVGHHLYELLANKYGSLFSTNELDDLRAFFQKTYKEWERALLDLHIFPHEIALARAGDMFFNYHEHEAQHQQQQPPVAPAVIYEMPADDESEETVRRRRGDALFFEGVTDISRSSSPFPFSAG
jgi:hypothetical protein